MRDYISQIESRKDAAIEHLREAEAEILALIRAGLSGLECDGLGEASRAINKAIGAVCCMEAKQKVNESSNSTDVIQWRGDNQREIETWCGQILTATLSGRLGIPSLNGTVYALVGEWIFRDQNGLSLRASEPDEECPWCRDGYAKTEANNHIVGDGALDLVPCVHDPRP